MCALLICIVSESLGPSSGQISNCNIKCIKGSSLQSAISVLPESIFKIQMVSEGYTNNI